MIASFPVPVLSPAIPEILLAVGAMLLLMLGVFRGGRGAGAVNASAIILLIAVAALESWLPGDR
jgi:NADH-quinone oxidoreductase subunit N